MPPEPMPAPVCLPVATTVESEISIGPQFANEPAPMPAAPLYLSLPAVDVTVLLFHVREAVLHELGLACRESLVLDAVEQLLLVREALAGPDGLELESKRHVGTPVHARSSGAHGAAPVGRSVQAHPTNVLIPKYELRSIAAGDRACSGRFPATPLDAPRIPAHAARPAARGGCARRTFDRYG